MRERMRRCAVPALLALVLLLSAAAACAEPPPPPAPEPPPVAVPGPVVTPPPAPLPPSEDGNDITACVDGSCEIQISGPVEIPLDARFGVLGLRVESIAPERVVFRAELADGGDVATVSCVQRTADATATTPASASAECEPGGSMALPTISMGVAVVRENAAIIRVQAR
jgi:hypothetical protein